MLKEGKIYMEIKKNTNSFQNKFKNKKITALLLL